MIYIPGNRCYKGFKLNTNENQFLISKNIFFLIKIMSKYFEKLNLYPDSNNLFFLQIISVFLKINKNKIFISNGSDESLFFIFYLFKNFKLKISKISYPFYNIYLNFYKIKNKKINFKKIIKFKNILLTIPNSPTGEIFKKKKILKIINKKNFLIIDEAYSDFYNKGYKKYINDNNNLLIITTLSKSFSAAGIRIGLVFSNKKIINKLNIIKKCFNSYNINTISSYIGIECIKDKNWINYNLQKNNYIQLLFNFFFKINNKGNFIFLKKNVNYYLFFKKKNFFFRNFKNYIRITIPKFFIFKLIINLNFTWS
ncbi:aminotransferase class I/II-fold pyridoxal phosphate-dependent enzyme [Candidatus Carsonella ruddii]|uniref:histidinol-phosphate transaminase n=1 Tax=Candidatus Carsonella ruddii HC isolate Thao2000 TaxID=1202538 RepID=J3TE81_CARRU|nr:aminotransferase class I/II-fold pyridoxal phosphate-dependent enzyme [Candidatus Carsonella ruddii]AFP83922.1 histidinol phosphate aminotransferase [Candidatus Carsonella ruddii HC isolate Thao2000]